MALLVATRGSRALEYGTALTATLFLCACRSDAPPSPSTEPAVDEAATTANAAKPPPIHVDIRVDPERGMAMPRGPTRFIVHAATSGLGDPPLFVLSGLADAATCRSGETATRHTFACADDDRHRVEAFVEGGQIVFEVYARGALELTHRTPVPPGASVTWSGPRTMPSVRPWDGGVDPFASTPEADAHCADAAVGPRVDVALRVGTSKGAPPPGLPPTALFVTARAARVDLEIGQLLFPYSCSPWASPDGERVGASCTMDDFGLSVEVVARGGELRIGVGERFGYRSARYALPCGARVRLRTLPDAKGN